MSAVDQVQMLMLGLVMLRVGQLILDLAWASSTPRIERITGWTMLISGLGFSVIAALRIMF